MAGWLHGVLWTLIVELSVSFACHWFWCTCFQDCQSLFVSAKWGNCTKQHNVPLPWLLPTKLNQLKHCKNGYFWWVQCSSPMSDPINSKIDPCSYSATCCVLCSRGNISAETQKCSLAFLFLLFSFSCWDLQRKLFCWCARDFLLYLVHCLFGPNHKGTSTRKVKPLLSWCFDY